MSSNESILTKKQTKTFTKFIHVKGKPECIEATVRHDDRCGNGHNTFSITGAIYTTERYPGEATIKTADGKTLWLQSCGCLHTAIAYYFPELAPLLKWHLCSTDGPLHYVANTTHLAGDRDCWGLRKGEVHQFKDKETGLPKWKLKLSYSDANKHVQSAEKPAPMVVEWEPWGRVGEGKERELDAARRSAIWPEATDEELTAPGLKERLEARLPALMAEFRAAVESLGFTY